MILTDQKLREMSDAIDARLNPDLVWDSQQKADVLHEAGYTPEEVNAYFEENSPF